MPQTTNHDLITTLIERNLNLITDVAEMKSDFKILATDVRQALENTQSNTTWRKIICAVGGSWLLIITGVVINILIGH